EFSLDCKRCRTVTRLRRNHRKARTGRMPVPRSQLRCEAAAHGVLAACAGLDELEQVVAAAGLGADAGHAEAAEGLAADECAGDAAVEVNVAHAVLALGTLKVRRLATEHAAGELVGEGVGELERGFVCRG